MSQITSTEFAYICDLARQQAAIILEPGKEYLVESRLLPVARLNECPSLSTLITKLRSESSPRLRQQVIEALTTNETSFFRDLYPFEALKTSILPELIAARNVEKKLVIWCAAASSGQEPYSLAILLREQFPHLFPHWNIRIIATDINTEVLEQAYNGIYSQVEINRGLPASMLVRYFTKQQNNWQISDKIRSMVEFKVSNLIGSWPIIPPVDIVFLRNVLIYFDQATKKTILGKTRQLLKPDGYLFLGGAETTMNIDPAFERVPLERTSAYRIKK